MKNIWIILIYLLGLSLGLNAQASSPCPAAELLVKLSKDLEDVPFKVFLEGNPGAVRAWELLEKAGYKRLKTNVLSLTKVSDLITNPKLSQSLLNENLVKDLIKGNRLAKGGAAALDDLTEGLNALVNSGTTFENIQHVISDLNKGGGFSEGAGWVMQYITKNVSEFENQVLKFEQNVISGRVDLKMGEVLYEFKSVKNLPPDKFVKQVTRDLKNVKDFEDMKWIFDKSKLNNVSNIKQADREKMLDALSGMTLDEDVIKKFVPNMEAPELSDLISLIDDSFDTIFLVK